MKWAGLFLTFLTLTLSRPVQAQASSELLITEVMTASNTSASSEFVEIYNQTDSPVALTGWKIQYQASSSDPISGAWTTKTSLDGQIKPRGFAIISSSIFDSEKSILGDFQMAAGLSGTAGRIRLFNGSSTIDSLTWGAATSLEGTAASAPPSGHSLKRSVDADSLFIDNNNNSTDFQVSDQPFAQGGGIEEVPAQLVDVCPATPEIDLVIPDGYFLDGNGSCVLAPLPTICSNNVVLSEFLTDPVGLESDGGEFIELFNPSDSPAPLKNCELHSSKSSQPLIEFSDSDIVPAGGYFVISLADKLTNSSGSVTFSTSDHEDVVNYSNVKEGQSMAFFADGWEMTNQSTPMASNLKYLDAGKGGDDESQTVSTLSECPEGKYRNPETNRCKNIDSSDAVLSSCDEGQIRNPETNRCKKIASTSSSLSPCGPGQERNSATNRCRKISSSAASLKPCEAGYERNPDTNRCRKVFTTKGIPQFAAVEESRNPIRLSNIAIGSFMTAALAYGAFEYRSEAARAYKNIRAKFIKGRPPD